MTFAELKAALDKLTPEQLAHPALWAGDDRGGEITSFAFTEEDCIRDEGDSGELFLRGDFEKSCAEYGDEERRAAGVITCPKGTPMLFTE